MAAEAQKLEYMFTDNQESQPGIHPCLEMADRAISDSVYPFIFL